MAYCSGSPEEAKLERSYDMANFLTVIHECKNFDTWKKAYDADAPKRTAAGLTQLHLLREHGNGNLIALMFGIKDVARAKAFGALPELANAMKAAGVVGPPKLRFRQGNYTPTTAATIATMSLTVRDFEAAMKAYAMDAADRKAASLTDAGVLQLSENPNNLLLLWAVGDIARATKFFDSPALAAHMAKVAGVIGTPERHFWKV